MDSSVLFTVASKGAELSTSKRRTTFIEHVRPVRTMNPMMSLDYMSHALMALIFLKISYSQQEISFFQSSFILTSWKKLRLRAAMLVLKVDVMFIL